MLPHVKIKIAELVKAPSVLPYSQINGENVFITLAGQSATPQRYGVDLSCFPPSHTVTGVAASWTDPDRSPP